MESWNLCCCRVGIAGTGGLGGVLAIILKAEVKLIHHGRVVHSPVKLTQG